MKARNHDLLIFMMILLIVVVLFGMVFKDMSTLQDNVKNYICNTKGC